MNPWCEEHSPPIMMKAVKRSYFVRMDVTRSGKLVVVKGYSRCYECPRCKKRIWRGG